MLQLPSDMPKGMGNCGIVGTAIFCGTTHNEVWDVIKRSFRKPGNWKGSSRHHERKVAIKQLNKKRSTSFKCKGETLNNWAQAEVREGMLYMVRTTRHIQCVMRYDGDIWVADQQGVNRLSQYWGRRKKTEWAMCRHA